MPYQAERDATIPKVIGTTRNAEGEKVAHYESVTYPAGAVIFEEDIAPHVLRRLEDGDDHVSSLLRAIDEAEARQILGQQTQTAASEPVDEDEILHQEERLGNKPGPSIDPEVEVSDEPPYEAPPAGDGGGGKEGDKVVTENQTVGQGTGDDKETATTDQEASDDDSAAEVEVSEGDSSDDGEEPENETESDDSGDGDDSDDSQEEGQDQADDSQEKSDEEEPSSDKFDGMDKKSLLEEAKARKISGRTKMTEDQLREALRAE